MPLLGIVDDERIVSSLLNEQDWLLLKADIKAHRKTVVLACGSPGYAKTSKLGTQHFAHKPGGDGCSAGETAQHLLAKAAIVQAARDAGWNAEPEVRGEGWIADVMATKDEVRVVFEVQWSRQSLEDFAARQKRYLDAGVASCAWFARHPDHLGQPRRALPVFGLTVEDGQPEVSVGGRSLPLAEAVTRLLTRRLQFREHVMPADRATAHVDVESMQCWKCRTRVGIWDVRLVGAVGPCGTNAHYWPDTSDFPKRRPETHPAIVALAATRMAAMNATAGRLAMRKTKMSGTTYMAFTCARCSAVMGEMFVRQHFHDSEMSRTASVEPHAIRHPHWCLAGPNGLCAVPPPQMVEVLSDPDAENDGRADAGLSVGAAVSAMFGGR